MNKKIIATAVASAALVLGMVPVFADSSIVVKKTDLANNFADVVSDNSKWFFYNDENDTIDSSLGSFVSGPATAPIGNGSVQISVTGTQRRNIATYQFSGTPLENITTLKFSTYNPSAGNRGSANRSGYLNFNVDFNGSDTWQRRLVFVPSDNGTVTQDTWQEWDALNGGNAMWKYSGTTWPGTATPGTTSRTWNDIVTSYPGIRIRVTDSWLGIRVGEPYADGYTENIDAFIFGTASGTKVFDFEPITRSAEITSPLSTDIVSASVNFNAYLIDDDEDPVNWAVRQGTCAAGVGTILGNVDGHSDVASWTKDGTDSSKWNFHFAGDATSWADGQYCFVFNPSEDAGETDIRLTREFTVFHATTPVTKDQCYKDGWKSFNTPVFKNQGDCVSYVQSNPNAVGNKTK